MTQFKEAKVIENQEIYQKLINVKSEQHWRVYNEPKFGYTVEADASVFNFFGSSKVYAHVFADRSTGKILSIWFDEQETLNGYQHAFYNLVKKYGAPMKLVTDCRTVFTYHRIKGDDETSKLTQFGYWCKLLGVELITTSVSQRKPIVERCHKIIQDRLTSLFSLHKNVDIQKANKLAEGFIDETNKALGYTSKGFENVFEKYNEQVHGRLDLLLSVRNTRMFGNGCVFSFEHCLYQAIDPQSKRIMNFKPRTQVLIMRTVKNEMILNVCDKFFYPTKYEKCSRLSIENIGFPILPTHPWMKMAPFIRYKREHPIRKNELFEKQVKSEYYNY